MVSRSEFAGFPPGLIPFFKQLAANNNRGWFQENRERYRAQVLDPAVAFVLGMGPRLHRFAPDIVADPRAGGAGSIFRIHRDTRFSPDKTPYKTHLGIHFSAGNIKTDSPGFYFHLEPGMLLLAVGHYQMGKESLARYREAVLHKTHGPALDRAVRKVLALPGVKLGGSHYKRVPRGVDPAHKYGEYLLHNGLYVFTEDRPPRELFGPGCADFVAARFKAMAPVYAWLRKAMG
jgi:uncharacterized protein (TIGR02453 family)